ncbi:hypothetical protein EVG20_g6878 [Dentipellis fragilis]|uniref:Uncharacterized protein n=1 Tax=Dentipellis fragilis TaxID=205917 RepID=A0A4Y9YIV8_9AGAM|nr:hypothetical protein EVG20_g6878 [Dentipellis fragilis]
MSLSTSVIDGAVGYEYPPVDVSWTKKDTITYALGVGAKKEDFQLLYELDKNFAILPTYPSVLGLKGTDSDVTLFSERVKNRGNSGLPHFDPNRVVHFTQTVEILQPLPVASGPGWKLTTRITSVNENKSGVIVENESLLVNANGTPFARLFSSAFNLGAKITGTKYGKSVASPPKAPAVPKDRKPDYVVHEQTTPEQAVLFRLSGDYNPLHIDPAIGKAGGFGGVILHGLSTYGFSGRALVNAVGGRDPSSLRYFGARFTAPVRPGDALEVSAWEVGQGPDGTTEVVFETKNLQTGKVAIGGGHAFVKKGGALKGKL